MKNAQVGNYLFNAQKHKEDPVMNPIFSRSRMAAKAASVIALGLIAATAQADIVPSNGPTTPIDLKYTGAAFGGYETFNITAPNSRSVLAGSLLFDTRPGTSGPATGTFASYCVQLEEFASGAFKTYNLTDFSSGVVGSSLAHLYQVAAGGLPPGSTNILGDKAASAAFQAAVWEIVYDSPNAGPLSYNLGTGSFQGNFGAKPLITAQANAWLADVNTFNAPTLYKAQQYVNVGRPGAQDYLVITSVPEPENYALLLAGLGLIGTIARRRQQKV